MFTCPSLYIFQRNLTNSNLEMYATPSTRGLHIKNL